MAGWNECNATIGVSSGKWYWEVLFVSTAELQGWIAGVRTTHGQVIDSAWSRGAWNAADDGYAYGIWDDGSETVGGGSMGSFTSALSGGDIIGFLLDLDSATTTFIVYVNNSLAGTLQSGLPAGQSWNPGIALANPYSGNNSIAIMNFGQDSSFAGQKTAQGNQDDNGIGDFYYDVPAGYLALCTSNLSAPEIADPTDHFNTKLYTGDGAERTITSGSFQPDFVWFKNRTTNHSHQVYDSVRGVEKKLYTDDDAAEATESQGLKSFTSTGYTIGTNVGINNNTDSQVAWNWKGDGVAGGTLNEDGDINTQVNVNTAAGFSIMTYTGTGTAGDTIGHGLSEAPTLVITKQLGGTGSWQVGSNELQSGVWTKYLTLETSDAVGTAIQAWNDTAPNANVITLGTGGSCNSSTDTFVCYAFHSVEGYSKIGSYVGNGSTDGVFCYCGFQPRYILCKNTSETGGNWWVIDSERSGGYGNEQVNALIPNLNNAGYNTTIGDLDFVSNGIKFRGFDDNNYNKSGVSYMFYAIAETPFRTSNAR